MNFLSPRLLRSLFILFASLILIPLAPQFAQAQSQSTPPAHKAPPSTAPPPAVDQQQFISYWTTETGWRTELQLRNNQVGRILIVTPVLRTVDGTETTLPPVLVQPQEVKTVDVETAIGTSAPQLIGSYGSVVLRYHTPTQATLYAVSMVMGIGHSIAFHIDATGEDNTENIGSREGIWWLPNATADDYLVLVNQGQNPLQLALSLYDASGKVSIQNLTLPPRGTNRLSARQLVSASKLGGSYGGIKVSAVNHAGSLDTLHVLFDQNGGFSAVMKMFDYDPRAQIKERDYAKTGQWTLRAPMLALSNPDPALAFPVGTVLQPQLFVRNTTSKPIDASLSFRWRTDTTTGKSSGPALHLIPYETRRVDVAALQDGKTLPQNAQWASVTMATTALPDEVVAVAASYDQSLQYGAQTPFSDQLAAHMVGGQWQYDPQHDSIITAGNAGSKPTQAAFTIFYNQGTEKYQLEQTLQPGEQMWMDIGKLIRESAPDKNGNTLPANLTSGSYELRDLTNKGVGTLFEGKVIYDKTYGHVTYGCVRCCGYGESVTLAYDPLEAIFDNIVNQPVQAPNECLGGEIDDVSESFYYNWSSADTAITTVDSYGNHTGVAMGSTTSQTNGSLQSNNSKNLCPAFFRTPTAPVNVNPSVSFSGTPVVPLGGTAPITATVTPTSNVSTINLTLTTTSGTGSAVFSNGQTSMNITSTTVLLLEGIQASSVPNNIALTASNGSGILAATNFTVAATGGAVPTNFRQIDAYDAGNGDLHFDYKWDSSSGNLADLTYCVVREYVTYPGTQNPYPFPSPPFPPDAYPNPATANVFGTQGSFSDDQFLTPSSTFVKPYSPSSFTGTQYYRFACTYYNSGNFQNIKGPNFIVRTVSQNANSSWEFTVTKSGAIATINPLP